jgi:predicted translation initiation factor SUI1
MAPMAKRTGKRAKKVVGGHGWELISGRKPVNTPQARGKSDSPDQQRITVRTEGRSGGKTVTIAHGFRLTPKDLKALAKKLKSTIGVGGKASDDRIELQGRVVDKVVAHLSAAGYMAQAR